MHFVYYLSITIVVVSSVRSTVIHPVPDSPIHDNSPEAYYNKYCKNNKCGENGECILMVKPPANEYVDDKYLCKCHECYVGKYCDINICQKNEQFFITIRMILLGLTTLVSILYVFGLCRFLSFYFNHIRGLRPILRATDEYFVDSKKDLNNLDGKAPTVFVLRKIFEFDRMQVVKNKVFKDDKKTLASDKVKAKESKSTSKKEKNKNIKTDSKNKSSNLSITGSETVQIEFSNVNEEKTTTPNTTKEINVPQNDKNSSKNSPVKLLTPFPTKYKMANIFGVEQLQKLGVISSPQSGSKKLLNDKDQ